MGELIVLGCLDGSALSAVVDWVICLGGYTPLIGEGFCVLGGGSVVEANVSWGSRGGFCSRWHGLRTYVILLD